MPPSRARRQAKCRKHRFRDKVAAKLALAEIQHDDKAHREKTETRAYPCGKCHGWHLTSQEQKRR